MKKLFMLIMITACESSVQPQPSYSGANDCISKLTETDSGSCLANHGICKATMLYNSHVCNVEWSSSDLQKCYDSEQPMSSQACLDIENAIITDQCNNNKARCK